MTADARVVLDRLAHLSTSASAAPWVAGENLTIGGWALYPPGSPVGTGREVADFCREEDARLIAAARNTLPPLAVALQAVLDLHVESESARALRKAGTGTATRYCVHDGQAWPCPTYRSVADALAPLGTEGET